MAAKPTEHPKEDPIIHRLLSRMPKSIANSFSTEQLFGLREAVGVRGGRLHTVDVRPTLKIPFVPWSFYFVFLLGRNRRSMTDHERYSAALMLLAQALVFVLGFISFVLLVLYLLKSALGINLFSQFSLGIWDWFNDG